MTAKEKLAMEHPGENIDKLCHDNSTIFVL